MFNGIGNQSGMFSQSFLSRFSDRYAQTAGTSATQSTEKTEEEQTTREKFAEVLKSKGMSEEKIANLPDSFWEKAEKKADKKNFNFADDKQLQKLADFLTKKADTVKKYQETGTAADSATISAEAKAAQEAASTEAVEEAEESDIVTVETEEETAAQSQNPLEAFRDKLNQILLDGLGLGDLSELSEGANVSAMSFSASFEISYSSMVAVAGENGMTMQETNFSLSASFDFMSMGQMGSDFDPLASFNDMFDNAMGGLSDMFGFGGAEDAQESEEVDSNDPMARLRDYFSPEKTADRILDFSLGFFGNSSQFKEGGNTEESRQNFADVIGAAIQKGFDQALGTLGQLPEKTQEEVDETHTRVFDGLDNFVKTGSKDEDEDRYAGIQAYSSVFEMNYSSVTAYYSAEETGAALDGLYDRYFGNGYGNQQVETQQAEESYQANPLDITA